MTTNYRPSRVFGKVDSGVEFYSDDASFHDEPSSGQSLLGESYSSLTSQSSSVAFEDIFHPVKWQWDQEAHTRKRKLDETFTDISRSLEKRKHKFTRFKRPFLEWPDLVRDEIYRALLRSPEPIDCPKLTTPYSFESTMDESDLLIRKPAVHLNILQTCWRVYREATKILYRENHFIVQLGHHQDWNWSKEWGRMLADLGPDDVFRLFYWYGVEDTRCKVPCYSELPFQTLRDQEFDFRRAFYDMSHSSLARIQKLTIWMRIDRHDSPWLSPDWSSLVKMSSLKTLGIVISVRDNDPPAPMSKLHKRYERQWPVRRVTTVRHPWKAHIPPSGLNWRVYGWLPSSCSINWQPLSDGFLRSFHDSSGAVFINPSVLQKEHEPWRQKHGQWWDTIDGSVEMDARKDDQLRRWMLRCSIGGCKDCRAKRCRCAIDDNGNELPPSSYWTASQAAVEDMDTVRYEPLKVEEVRYFEQPHKLVKDEDVEALIELAEEGEIEENLNLDREEETMPAKSTNLPSSGNEIWHDAVKVLEDNDQNLNDIGLRGQQLDPHQDPISTTSEDLVDEDIPWSIF